MLGKGKKKRKNVFGCILKNKLRRKIIWRNTNKYSLIVWVGFVFFFLDSNF